MRGGVPCLLLAALALGASQRVLAATIGVDCNASPLTALGAALPGLSPGDTIEISGICQEDVTITVSEVTLTFNGGAAAIQGQVEIAGARQIVIDGLLLGNSQTSFSFAAPADQALLYAHDGASVALNLSSVANSPLLGILAENSSQITLIDSSVAGSGSLFGGDATASPQGFGIRATNGSAILLASSNSTAAVESNQGGGIALLSGSSFVATSSFIDSNGGRQILLSQGSSAHVTNSLVDGSTCGGTHPLSACGDAIDVTAASDLRIDGQSTFVSAVQNQSAIQLSLGSAMIASGISVTVQGGTVPTIQASDNSIVALAGGNTICSTACSGATTGIVMQIDHVSMLLDVPPQEFGYPSGRDALFGSGAVQLQSTIDLGLGTIPIVGPSLTWTTGANGLNIAQNSSLRFLGGVSITGKVNLSQGSNGFFSIANGGTNVVTDGVSCPFTATPSAHIAAGNANTLSPTPVLATSFLSAAGNQCMPF
jgi:hypothetical protein